MKTAQEIFNEKQLALARPRLDKVAEWCKKGLGPAEIGKLLGVSTQRAWQLIKRVEKAERKANCQTEQKAKEQGWI